MHCRLGFLNLLLITITLVGSRLTPKGVLYVVAVPIPTIGKQTIREFPLCTGELTRRELLRNGTLHYNIAKYNL